MVIAGASSGMGRLTAIEFARRGARVAVIARNGDALDGLCAELRQHGVDALAFAVDVSNAAVFRAAVDAAAEQFGRIDTFVNFAATAVYAPFAEMTAEEFRRVIDVNLNGQAYGAMAALPHLQKNGGALIVISSIEGVVGMPYHSAYAASKHGLNALVEVLRMEQQHAGNRISITGIMPAGVNTPFFSNARTKLGVKPRPPQPIYAAEHVAEAVLFAAEHPVEQLYVGGAAKFYEILKRFTPTCLHAYLRGTAFESQRTREAKSSDAPSGLFASETHDTRIEGDFSHETKRQSCYLWFQTHPEVTFALKLAGYLGLVLLLAAPAAKRVAHRRTWWQRLCGCNVCCD